MGQARQTLYTELEYIESTGTQYIDTKYICGNDVRIETEFEYLQIDSAFRCIYGKQTRTAAKDAITVSQAVNYSVQAYWKTNRTPFTLVKDRKYKMLQSQNALVLDGVDYGGWSSSVTKSKLTMYLMARNNNGVAGNFFKGRIYSFKIYENDILAMDLIPVFDNKLRKPCLYDKEYHKFYYNAGEGEFLYKPKNPVELEYLESDGYQCIDSGVCLDASSDIKTVVELEIPSFNKNGNMLFGGAMSTSYNLYTCHISQEDNKYYLNFKYGHTFDDYTARQEINLNQKYTVTISRNYFSVDNNQYENPNSTTKFEADKTDINLFSTSATGIRGSYVRIYSAKIYKDNVLVRDFVPMLNTDGVLCLYDKVESKYYYNTFVGDNGYRGRPFTKWKYRN